jgi:hypothetical protein
MGKDKKSFKNKTPFFTDNWMFDYFNYSTDKKEKNKKHNKVKKVKKKCCEKYRKNKQCRNCPLQGLV